MLSQQPLVAANATADAALKVKATQSLVNFDFMMTP